MSFRVMNARKLSRLRKELLGFLEPFTVLRGRAERRRGAVD